MPRSLMPFLAIWSALLTPAAAAPADEGAVLPFPAKEMPSVTKERLQDSSMKWPTQAEKLPDDAPNILIVLLDDVGFGVAETFGGEVRTPALDKLADEGIRFNTFHTTSICSPTRASLPEPHAHRLRHHR